MTGDKLWIIDLFSSSQSRISIYFIYTEYYWRSRSNSQWFRQCALRHFSFSLKGPPTTSSTILLPSRLFHLIWFMKELWKVMSNFCLYLGRSLTRSTFNTSIELLYCLIKGASGLISFPTCQGQVCPKLKWPEPINCLTKMTSSFLRNAIVIVEPEPWTGYTYVLWLWWVFYWVKCWEAHGKAPAPASNMNIRKVMMF